MLHLAGTALRGSTARRLNSNLLNVSSAAVLSAQDRSQSTDAFAVIVGGGVAGCSLAYHLTKRNIKDVVVLEKSALASPSATTFHSPGLVNASHPSHRYKKLLNYTVKLYSQLEEETGKKVTFERPGTIRLATNPRRLEEMQRYVSRDYFREGDPCKTRLITPEEVAQLAPILNVESVLGALYTEGDGYINTQELTHALAKGAELGGATVINNCPEFNLRMEANGEWIVEFADGRPPLRCRNIVNAAGLWAEEVAHQTDVHLPIVHVEHQYAKIGPISDLSPDKLLPAIIDHDSTFYVRQSKDQLLFGGFESQGDVVIREDWYKNGIPKEGGQSLKPDFARISNAFDKACNLISCLKTGEIQPRVAAFTMTPDGYPLVGPIDTRQNYWLHAGFLDGVGSGGGIAKYLADWMVDGEPSCELFDTDANRFDRWADRQFVRDKSVETYSMYYNWSYTNRLVGRPTTRVSGVYGRLVKEGGEFTYRNGWEVANAFNVDEESPISALTREYEMVVNKCGLIDLSWKGKIEIKGPDAVHLLDFVLANPVPQLGSITSGLMLTHSGRIMGPLKIFHHDSKRSQFIILTDPERESRDLHWLRRAANERNFDVEVNAVSQYLSSLALVGPNSRDVLSELTKSDVSDAGLGQRATKLMRLANNVPVIAARTSTSTGLLSYEFFHNRADSLKLYDVMMRVGAPHGLVNFGQAAMNAMRLEHAYKLWGRELTLDTNPFEAGLGHLVDFSKEEFFIGKAAAQELAQKPVERELSLLQLKVEAPVGILSKHIPQGMEIVRNNNEQIGEVTSGGYSVHLQTPLVFAWLKKGVDTSSLTVDVGGERFSAVKLDQPPVDRKN
uniref:Dimethylglycine dehydrogenase, mitochondrial n=1 Tax=Steinernema glaseri TaxID=37863 RepID=A0A1I7ZM32_9BILA